MNNATPLVSVWMITYNHAPYLGEALDSVLAQKADFPFEVVVGEDCSSDGTREILAEYARRDARIRPLMQPVNLGMIANQNATFRACRGEFIAMLEGDDFWTDTGKLQRQVDAMRANPQCDLSFHPCIETTSRERMSWLGRGEKIVPLRQVILGGGYFCPTASLMLRRAVVQALPAFLDAAPAGDYYLQILGAARGGALYLPRIMCAYRKNAAGSWSSSLGRLARRQEFRRKTLEALQGMDAHLGGAYHEVFQQRRAAIELWIAFDYLRAGERQAFEAAFAQLERLPAKKSLYFHVIRTFRRWPAGLELMYRLFGAIRSFRNRT